jgi:hypothetical protein
MGLFFRDDDQDGKDLQKHHNDGEQDASEGKYDTPWTSLESVLDSDKHKANDAYMDGWNNTKNQEK